MVRVQGIDKTGMEDYYESRALKKCFNCIREVQLYGTKWKKYYIITDGKSTKINFHTIEVYAR